MKNRMIKSLIFFSLFVSATLVGQTRVLFVGNSLTFTHNIPALFQDLATAAGYNTEADIFAVGGTGLVHHVDNPAVYEKFREGDWDVVVLQGGTSEMAAMSQPIQATIDRSQRMADSIRLYNACAELVFFELHAQEINNNPDCIDDQDFCFNWLQDLYLENTQILADSNLCYLAPVGEMWRAARFSDQVFDLWSSDHLHPAAEGAYLSACSFFVSIFDEPLDQNSFYGGTTAAQALALQEIANTVYQEGLDDWRRHSYLPTAAFDYEWDETTLLFDNQSAYADAFTWVLPDGTTVESETTSFQWPSNLTGAQEYQLIAERNCKADTLTVMIDAPLLSIDELSNPYQVYPNPSAGDLFLSGALTKDMDIYVYNLVGKMVLHHQKEVKGETIRIPTAKLTTGTYILGFETNEGLVRMPFYKN